MRADVNLTNFTAGELSPRMRGRVDIAKYWNGAEELLNFVVQPQGGATRRPGTAYVYPNASQTSPPRLIPFVFSTVQAYVLEFGPATIRIFRNDGVVVSAGSPVTVTSPYQAADLAAVKFFQSADTLFLCHPNYPVQALTRSSDTSWAIAPYAFTDGPYLTVNGLNNTTLTIGAAGGPGASVTVTASSIVGINATASNTGQGFLAGDVGRHLRINLSGLWSWLKITAVTSTLAVQATVQAAVQYGAIGGLQGQAWTASTFYAVGAIVTNGGHSYLCVVAGFSAGSGGPTGTTVGAIIDNTVTWNYSATAAATTTPTWALGKWCSTTGYPFCGLFWQERMVLAGSNNQPNALDGSVPNAFTAFPPSAQDSSVSEANALSFIIADDQVNSINWLATAGSAQAVQLGIGTQGGEQILQAGSQGAELSPTNVQAYRETSYGSRAAVQPLRIGHSLIFPNRPGQKLHEWTFTWQVNGYVGPDIAVLGEHLLRAGLNRVVYQQNPLGVIWGISGTGLVAVTYLREQDVVALTSQQLGGQYYGAPPIVEDLAVIPSSDGTYDELWLAVCRTVSGTLVRTIEVMKPFFAGTLAEQGWYLDCATQTSLTTPASGATIAGLTAAVASDGSITYAGSGTLTLGAAPSVPLAIGQVLRMNGGVGVVSAVAGTQTATVVMGAPMTSLAPAAAGAWSLTAPVSSVTGMGYLAGEPVGLVGDGLDYGILTAAPTMALSPLPASLVLCGLPYTSFMCSMPLEPLARSQQSAQGKAKKPGRMFVRLDSSIGGSVGTRTLDPDSSVVTDEYEALPQRLATAVADAAMALFTGVRLVSPSGSSDYEGRVIVLQNEPMPLTLLAIGLRMDIGEGTP